jgi:uncharacterized protein (TIGR02271 family)
MVNLSDGQHLIVPVNRLEKVNENNYHLPVSFSAFNNSTNTPPSVSTGEESLVVPVIEQQLRVMKKQVETGRVRVTKNVHQHQEIVDQPLTQEEVNVQRITINQMIEGPLPEARQEGETMIIPLFEEVLVMEKRIFLKEELRITKRKFETRNPQHVTLRSEEVNVERIEPSSSQSQEVNISDNQ